MSANIALILRAQAKEWPRSTAIIDRRRGKDRTTTFADLEAKSARAAALLAKHGLRAGDVALIFHPMSAELYAALLAVFRLGMTAMFLDPSAGRTHIEQCCAIQPPKALIAGAKAHLLRLVSPALRRVPRKFVIGWPLPFTIRWSAADRLSPLTAIESVDADAPALLTFTSGSTGQPKAAVRTHGFLRNQHRILEHHLELKPGGVDLTTLPIVLLANLASGVASVIPDGDLRSPGEIDPVPVLRHMEAHGVTSSTASPAFFERLARHANAHGVTFPNLQRLFTGGAPVFPRLLDQMQRLAPNAEIVGLYGSTEAEPIAHVRHRDVISDDVEAMVAGNGLLTGEPVEEIRLRILRDQWGKAIGPYSEAAFQADCLPNGEAGEIVVSGAHVLRGYLHGHGDEETKFRVNGQVWHRTGDAGRLDERGRLWLLGRCAARIQDANGELYPFAAECAAYQDSAVRRAAALAHDGKRLLLIECFEGESAAIESLRRRVAWAGFDEVRVVKRIPVDKRHNAKIDYPALRRMLGR